MLSGKQIILQIILLLIVEASIIGIALSDTNNTSVENMTTPVATSTDTPNVTDTTTPVATATPNITSNVTDTPLPNSTETPSITTTNTPIPTVTGTTISYAGKRPTVIITFDDGWLSLYDKAFPIMRANNQSGVAFVNVEPILGGWPNFISKADINIMYTSGWDISSHTFSHVDLTLQNDTSLKHELNDTKIWLDQNGYTKSSMFLSYPYGGYNNATVLAAVKNAGFLAARTVDPTTDYVHYTLISPDILAMKNYEAIGGIDSDATIINQINNAIAVNGLLILSFHKIVYNLSADENNASTEFRVSDFQNVSNYLKNSNVDVRTLSDYFGIIPKLAPIVTTTTPIVTTTPNPAKYTIESGGSSSGYYIVQYTPPKPTPTLNIIKTPIPIETPEPKQVTTSDIIAFVTPTGGAVHEEQNQQGTIISWLESRVNSILGWIKSFF
jgi:peptidoglycan/xylan/chitin deacetylase (PgdA/CDA1 family)